MKTTLEPPDPLFRMVKATAAECGQSSKDFVTDALREKLSRSRTEATEPSWMTGFGKLKRLRKETSHVQSIVDQEFDVIDPEDRY